MIRTRHFVRLLAGVSVFGAGAISPARADSVADLSTRPASSATVTAQVTLSTSLGGGTDTETDTGATDGVATAMLAPTDPAWTSVTLDPFEIDIAPVSYHFQFTVFLILDVTVSNFRITSEAPLTASIGPGGTVNFTGGMFRATGSMLVTGLGGLVNSTFPLDSISSNNFSGRLTENGGVVVFDQKMITPITGSVPATELPSGINSVDYIITVNLGNTIFEGAWTPIVSCDGDSYATIHACMTGPGTAYAGDCACADRDSDGDVDMRDFVAFQ